MTALCLGAVLVTAPAAPAWACSCVGTDGQDERADLIVVGTVTTVTDTGIQLAVESVVKGSVGAATTVALAVGRSEASCGYAFTTGRRYRIHSSDASTGLCAGIEALAAAPSPPAAAPTPMTAAPVATAPVAAAPVGSSSRWWLPAGGAVAAVLVAGLVGWALRRRLAQ